MPSLVYVTIPLGIYFMGLFTIALRETHECSALKAVLMWLTPPAVICIVVGLTIAVFTHPITSPTDSNMPELIRGFDFDSLNLSEFDFSRGDGSHKRYEDSGLGFSMTYNSKNGWYPVKGSGGVEFENELSDVDVHFEIEVKVGVGEISAKDAQYIITSLSDLPAFKSGMISEREFVLNGENAYEIVGESSLLDSSVKFKEVYIVNENMAYLIQYFGSPGNYSKNEKIINDSINSFTILDI